MLVQVLRGFFAHVGDVVGQFFHSALGVTDFQHVFIDVQRSEHIFTHNALGNHNGILKIVALPWHEGHLHVLAEGQFTFLGGVSLHQNLASNHFGTLLHHRLQVHACALVGPGKLGEVVHTQVCFEGHQKVIFIHVVTDADLIGIHVLHHTITLGPKENA